MPKLHLELLGAPEAPYPHLRVSLTVDVYGRFTRASAQAYADAVQTAVTDVLRLRDIPQPHES